MEAPAGLGGPAQAAGAGPYAAQQMGMAVPQEAQCILHFSIAFLHSILHSILNYFYIVF